MASENKKPAAADEKKSKAVTDRKRLGYLKIRFKEVREEMAAIRNEMTELKSKTGAGAKRAAAKGKAKAGAGDEDED